MIPTLAMTLAMMAGIWIGVGIGRSGWSLGTWLQQHHDRLEARITERYMRNLGPAAKCCGICADECAMDRYDRTHQGES